MKLGLNTLFFLLLICVSCKRANRNYNEVSIIGDFNNTEDLLKIGKWYYIDKFSNDTLKFGSYQGGHTVNAWRYSFNDKKMEINWNVFEDSIFSISYPETWNVKKKDSFLFYSLKDSIRGYNVVRRDLKTIKSLDSYFEAYLHSIGELNLVDINFRKKIIQDSISVYNGSFTYLKSDSTYISCISSVFQKDKFVYDCTYFVRNVKEIGEKDKIFEEEMTHSIFINSKPVFILPYVSDSKLVNVKFVK